MSNLLSSTSPQTTSPQTTSPQTTSPQTTQRLSHFWTISSLTSLSWLAAALPALAHHPSGGETPTNFIEGFLSGLGHPVIGLDHLVFVVAIGLIAAKQSKGIFVVLAFLLSAMLGTSLHLASVNLPGSELVIAGSVVAFGAMLLFEKSLNGLMVIGLGAIAGLFHGYAYGEAIIGAEMTPILAYLAGFTLIQLGIAAVAQQIGRAILQTKSGQPAAIRFSGLAICAVGLVFLTTSLLG
ncbi:MAG: HupE/UreJ family protein [Leptolyngbyaceae cyanobacterium SL_5_9]|nr:HupE/UreJ family protein [Leptolyngbyaceae cyanobacterium SL_5_9]NJO73717.1 HupE/UreJ family protein [Leptolyngbyaceae cyanobacterium RM1_406_9]